MEQTRTFVATDEDKLKRLDVFLTGRIPGLTRSGIQGLIKKGLVLVENRPAKPGHRMAEGERVVVTVPEPEPLRAVPEPIPLDIIYEDGDLLVLNKPPGIAVHPGAGRTRGTLINALLNHTKKLSAIGGPLRPGIVHRLDRDTSGVIVVAKTNSAHISLAKQFKDHTTERSYLAIVWGQIKDDEGTIDIPIGRDTLHRKKISPRTRKARRAVTRFRVLGRYGYFSLLELRPETGRTHQIRVHLSAIGHPVVGDPVYCRRSVPGAMPQELRQALAGIKRQLLHAARLVFFHPGLKKRLEFSAPLPPDMEGFLTLLEKKCSKSERA